MLLIANNAATRLAASITAGQTTISVFAGTGSLFPVNEGSDWFPLTIISTLGEIEIVRCTGRVGDVMSVVRGQEGTISRSFAANSRVELRFTAAIVDMFNGDIGAVRSDLTTLQGGVASLSTSLSGSIAALSSRVDGLFPPGFGPLPWSRTTEPSGWIFADGRVLLAATPYTALRDAYIADGFPHGQDGSGNPKVPDMRGSVPAGRDNMGGTAAGRLTGATALSAFLGQENVTLTLAQIPAHNHAVTDPGHSHSANIRLGWSTTGGQFPYRSSADNDTYLNSTGSAATGISIQNNGGGGSHSNVQPTRVMNYIVKV